MTKQPMNQCSQFQRPIRAFQIIFCVFFSVVAIPSFADIKIPDDRHIGFSGIEYHVPKSARMVLYKYKAQKNRSISLAGELEDDTLGIRQSQDALRTVTGVDQDIVADCSIAIGNNTQTDIFAPKEQVVIIEGDVVNLGDCD